MNPRTLFAAIAIACATSVTAMAEEKELMLSEVHLCCQNCVTGANNAIKPVTGVTAAVDRNARTIALTAPDKESAQKAASALLAAGYFGKSSDAAIKMDAPSGAPDGKVKTATVTGVHMCCNTCVTTVKTLLTKIDGVTGNTVAIRAASFNVTGDFSAKQLFDALQAEGLAGKYAATPPTTAPSGQ